MRLLNTVPMRTPSVTLTLHSLGERRPCTSPFTWSGLRGNCVVCGGERLTNGVIIHNYYIAGIFRGYDVRGFRWLSMYREHLYPQINITCMLAKAAIPWKLNLRKPVFPRKFIPTKYTRYTVLKIMFTDHNLIRKSRDDSNAVSCSAYKDECHSSETKWAIIQQMTLTHWLQLTSAGTSEWGLKASSKWFSITDIVGRGSVE